MTTDLCISIAGREISCNPPPYFIAEMSAIHNGELSKAFEQIEQAYKAGADAVKIQTYTADTLTLDSDREHFLISDGIWAGRILCNLYKEASKPWDWYKPLFHHSRKLGVTLLSSPFDEAAIDQLEGLGAPAYKIAAFEAIDLPLIRNAAATGKPMINSTSMANIEETAEAIVNAHDGGCRELAILHCVSGYPSPPGDYNLNTIPEMIERFGLVTGLLDHTLDNTTAIASIALGSSIIEKHFTVDRNGSGPVNSFSLEPDELAALCKITGTAWSTLGQVDFGRKFSEMGNVEFRRSLYFIKPLSAGEKVTRDAVQSVQPSFGLPPKYLNDVLGSAMTEDVDHGTAVS